MFIYKKIVHKCKCYFVTTIEFDTNADLHLHCHKCKTKIDIKKLQKEQKI